MKNRNLLPMKLQFFAEGSEGAGTNDGTSEGTGAGTGTQEQPPSFDDILANKGYQAEFDRRISKALETAKSKWETDYTTKLEEAKTEAAKLAQMNAEQKAAYEAEKKAKEIDDREKAVTQRELMAEAKNTLSDKNLPVSLATVLNYSDADKCKESIETVSKAFEEAVQKAVEDRLKGGKPPKKASVNNVDDVAGASDFVSIIKENQSKR